MNPTCFSLALLLTTLATARMQLLFQDPNLLSQLAVNPATRDFCLQPDFQAILKELQENPTEVPFYLLWSACCLYVNCACVCVCVWIVEACTCLSVVFFFSVLSAQTLQKYQNDRRLQAVVAFAIQNAVAQSGMVGSHRFRSRPHGFRLKHLGRRHQRNLNQSQIVKMKP